MCRGGQGVFLHTVAIWPSQILPQNTPNYLSLALMHCLWSHIGRLRSLYGCSQTDRQTDRKTDRQTDTGRQAGRKRQADRQAGRQTAGFYWGTIRAISYTSQQWPGQWCVLLRGRPVRATLSTLKEVWTQRGSRQLNRISLLLLEGDQTNTANKEPRDKRSLNKKASVFT